MKNPSRIHLQALSLSYESLSLIGLVILAVETFSSATPSTNSDLLKWLSCSVFASICVFGVVAGTFPKRCSQTAYFAHREEFFEKEENHGKTVIPFAGHHPVCGRFSSHVFRFLERTFCAGCAGLVLGAIIALLATVPYLLFGQFAAEYKVLVFWLGFATVAVGLLQYHVPEGDEGLVHFSINAIFVFGTFLLLVGTNEIMGNPVLSAYLLILTVYWIVARIMVSKLKHQEICAACPQPCSIG